MFHLDTDTVIALLRGNRKLADHVKSKGPPVGISTLVLAELIYGACASHNPPKSRKRLDRLLASLVLVPFELAAADAYGRIRLELRKIGQPIGDIDTLIAAVAVANDATLVTHNIRHFAKIGGLRCEDWIEQ